MCPKVWQTRLFHTPTKELDFPSLTLRDRAELYNQAFPRYAERAPMWATDHYLLGIWMIGNEYSNLTDFHGAYPRSYLDRMRVMFPDCPPELTLHLFAGSLDNGVEGLRVDLESDQRHPHIITDAHHLPFRDNHWRIIYADPPYTNEDANHYGTPMVNRNNVVKECARVLVPHGFLIWLDQVYPMYSSDTLVLKGKVTVIRSTNHRYRVATIFQKDMHPSKRMRPQQGGSRTLQDFFT